MAWEGHKAVREEQVRQPKVERGRGSPELENGGVGETALQGAQIHWKKRNFTVGPWGSSRGSQGGGEGQAARFGRGVTGEGIQRWGIDGIRIGTPRRIRSPPPKNESPKLRLLQPSTPKPKANPKPSTPKPQALNPKALT